MPPGLFHYQALLCNLPVTFLIQHSPIGLSVMLMHPHQSNIHFDTCPPLTTPLVLVSLLRNLDTLNILTSTGPTCPTRGDCSWELSITMWLTHGVWKQAQLCGQHLLSSIQCFLYTMAKAPYHLQWNSLQLPSWEAPVQDPQFPVHITPSVQWWWVKIRGIRCTCRSHDRFSMPNSGWTIDMQTRERLTWWRGVESPTSPQRWPPACQMDSLPRARAGVTNRVPQMMMKPLQWRKQHPDQLSQAMVRTTVGDEAI